MTEKKANLKLIDGRWVQDNRNRIYEKCEVTYSRPRSASSAFASEEKYLRAIERKYKKEQKQIEEYRDDR